MLGIASIKAIEALPDLSKRQRGITQITIRPETPGGQGDSRMEKLEKAAVQGVEGTLPERIVWKWLDGEGLSYAPQYTEFGGRSTVGGAVIDFVVWGLAGVPVAIRVQGGYWHGPAFHERTVDDLAQAERLRAQGYLVLDLWEQEVYDAVLFGRLDDYIRNEIV